MKKRLILIIKIIIFIIILIYLLNVLTKILIPKWVSNTDPALPRIKGFYKEKESSIDIIALGNSNVGRGFSPITLWDKYGITSYDLGTSNQTISLAYYLFKETLNYQKPQVIVLDMNSLFQEKDAPEGEYRKLFDNLKLGSTKLEAIFDQDLGISNKSKLSYVFPIFRFHSRWSELNEEDFKLMSYNKYDDIAYKGMAVSSVKKAYIDKNNYMGVKQDENSVIPDKNLKYFEKIVKICDKNNIKLLLIEIPSTYTWSLDKSNKTVELAKKYKLQFIDYNLKENINRIKFNDSEDYADGGYHLNVVGAEKITNDLGQILVKKYNCINHKDDEKYAHWNEVSNKYHKRIK